MKWVWIGVVAYGILIVTFLIFWYLLMKRNEFLDRMSDRIMEKRKG